MKVAEAQVDVAKANKAAAEAALVKAEENLKYCTISAPATGGVGQSLVAPGTLVDAYKTELVSVYPINARLRRVGGGRADVALVPRPDPGRRDRRPAEPGHAARGHHQAEGREGVHHRPGRPSRHSVVDYIDPEIVRGTGTRTVRATFQNPPTQRPERRAAAAAALGRRLGPRAAVGRATPRPVLTVPETVVFTQQRKQYVYVVADGKAQLREVEPGAAFDGMVEVNRGRRRPRRPAWTRPTR